MIRILSVAVPARILTLILTEAAILFGCYFFAVWIDPDIPEIASFVQFDAGVQRIAIVVVTILLGFYFRNLYSAVRMPDRLSLAQELITVLGATLVVQGLVHYVSADLTLPRKVMLYGSPLVLVTIFAWRLFFDAASLDARTAQRILFLGMSPAALELTEYLRSRREMGIQPVGYLSDRPQAAEVPGLPHLGGFASLDDVFEREQPSSIVIAQREEVLPEWSEDFLELEFGGVRIEEVTALYERTFGRVHVSAAALPRFIFSEAFEPDPITSRLQAIYSPVIALLALILLSPLLVVLALTIRFSSPGPVILRDWRLGADGVPFRLLRFRMRGVPGEVFIRRFGLDALPQFWNVLRGSMSIVGPTPQKPETVEEISRTIPLYRQRHRVKPGLTGWEQVHRHLFEPQDVRARLEYDLYYVKNLAPSLDSAVLMLALKEKLL